MFNQASPAAFRAVLCAIAVIGLGSCSPDPAKHYADLLASGKKYAAAGKYQDAVIQFRNAIDLHPRSADAHYQLALAYLNLKSPQQAYQELVSTVDLDRKNTDAQLRLAALFLAARKYEDAQKVLDTVIALEPGNATAHSLLGEKRAATQAWDSAAREFQTAMTLDPRKTGNYAGLAMVYASTGKSAEAEATLRKAVELQPKSLEALVALGRFYYMQHRPREAEAALRTASDSDPHAKEPRVLLTKIYLDAGRIAEAEQVCRELKKSLSGDPEAFAALASFYETTGQKEKEAAELREMSAAHPKELVIKARLTDVLIDLDRVPEADRLNQSLLSASPDDARVLCSRGRILLKQEKYNGAKAVLEHAIQSDPQSASSYYYLGVTDNTLGALDNARSNFARALELAPGLADAAIALADLDLRIGDWDDAIRLAQQVLQTHPVSPAAHVIAGKALVGKGNALRAETEFESSLEQDPVFLPALAAMLDLRIGQGRIKESIQSISALASKRPENANIRLLLAQAYLKQGDLAGAEAAAKQAIAIDRNTPDAYGVLGEISRARGAFDEAISWYKMATEANPKKPENFMALSGLYGNQGDWPNAIHAAEHAYSLDPGSPFVANNLAFLYLEHGGDIHAALSLAQEARRKLPDSPIVSDTIGWAYYKLGSPDAAVGPLSESVRRSPANPTYRYHLGMALLGTGKPGEAARYLQQALSTDPKFPEAGSARATLRTLSKDAR